MRRTVSFLVLAGLAACGDRPPEQASAPAWFVEESAARGLDFTWHSGHAARHYFPEIMGGGAALVDLDEDGDLDAYLVQAGGIETPAAERPSDRLFRNDGAGSFADATAASGVDEREYGMGVAAGDVDDDGRIDLYVTNVGPNVLLRNLGGGRLADETAARGGGDPAWSTSAAFFDYDRDGDLDLYVANYVVWSAEGEITCFSKPHPEDYCSPKSYDAPAPDTLFRNDGGVLRDVSVECGLRAAFGNGLGVVCADFDGDGFEDVFVANDGVKNQLWVNQAGQRFVDRAQELGCAVDQDGHEKAGMGTAAADLDDDGDEDLLVVNLTGETDTLFRNDRAHFADRTAPAGIAAVSRPYTRFGTGFADFDDDGRLDLYQANGRVTRDPEGSAGLEFEQPNVLFRGAGPWRFAAVAPVGGTSAPLVATSRAAAFGDVDGDGGVDVLVVNRDAPAYLLLNRVPERGNWIAFRAREAPGRDALGARIELRIGERAVSRSVRSAYSYCAANDPRVHLGLGTETGVRAVVVTWVGGAREAYGDFPAGAVVELVRGKGTDPGN
jgi:hypothetical protein